MIFIFIISLAGAPTWADDHAPLATASFCAQKKAERIAKVMETMHLAGNANIDDENVRNQIAVDKCREIESDGPRRQCEATYHTILKSAQQAQAKLSESCNDWTQVKNLQCAPAQTDCLEKLRVLHADSAAKFDEALRILDRGRHSVADMSHENRRAIEELQARIDSGLDPHQKNLAMAQLRELKDAREASVNFSGEKGFAPTEIQRLEELRKQHLSNASTISGDVDRMGPVPDGSGSKITGPTGGQRSPAGGGALGAPDPGGALAERDHDEHHAPAPSPVTSPANQAAKSVAADTPEEPLKQILLPFAAAIPTGTSGTSPTPSPNVAQLPATARSPAKSPPGLEPESADLRNGSPPPGSPETVSQRRGPTEVTNRTITSPEDAAKTVFSGSLGTADVPQFYGRVGTAATIDTRGATFFLSSSGFSSTLETSAQVDSGRRALAIPSVRSFVDKEVAKLEHDHPMTDALRESLRRKLASRMADQMEETRLKNAVDKGASGTLAAVLGGVSAKADDSEKGGEEAFRLGASETDAEVKRLLGRETEEKLSEIPGVHSAQSLFERVHGAHKRFQAKR